MGPKIFSQNNGPSFKVIFTILGLFFVRTVVNHLVLCMCHLIIYSVLTRRNTLFLSQVND